MSTSAIDLVVWYIDEFLDDFLDRAFATEKALAKIDSSLLVKTPFMENWAEYAYPKTQGEIKWNLTETKSSRY